MSDTEKVIWLCNVVFVVGGALGVYVGYAWGMRAGFRLAVRVQQEVQQAQCKEPRNA